MVEIPRDFFVRVFEAPPLRWGPCKQRWPRLEKEQARLAALKAQGKEVVVKKKPQIAEERYDDCGEDFSGLDKDIALLMHDATNEDIVTLCSP